MATKKTYAEKLRDPRWQRKRLEVMQRDNFSCLKCHDTTKTLNVHHFYYEPGRDPWQYDARDLATLCEDCHKEETDIYSDTFRIFKSTLADKKFFAAQIIELAEYIHYLGPDAGTILDKLLLVVAEENK